MLFFRYSQVAATGTSLVALELLYCCAQNRKLADLWNDLLEKSKEVTREVQRFVSTGQRSIVEKYLSEAQFQEATTSVADYRSRYNSSRQRLATLLGMDADVIGCPIIEDLTKETERAGIVPSAKSNEA